jgi:hypothetical protein
LERRFASSREGALMKKTAPAASANTITAADTPAITFFLFINDSYSSSNSPS